MRVRVLLLLLMLLLLMLLLLLLLLPLLLLLFVHAGVVVWLQVVRMCKVWFSSCSGSESLPLRLQQSEFRGGQSPDHLSPIFHRHPRHLGGVFL